MFMRIYETIDGNGEYEREFETEQAMRVWVTSMDGLLVCHTCYNPAGEEI